MKDSDTIIQYAKLVCPKELSKVLDIVKEGYGGQYVDEFVKSKKIIDFYAIPCGPDTKIRCHDITMGYIASEDTSLTIDYSISKDKDIYALKKGEFIWAFKQTCPFPIVAFAYYRDTIATGQNVYEIRCLLADDERRIINRDDNHILADGWCLKIGEFAHSNTDESICNRPLKRNRFE
jgi:hypothetical protein